MAVVHLSRPTRFPRKNMSAANLLCKDYPLDQEAHKIIWGLVSRSEGSVSIDVLRLAVEQIIFMSKA